MTGLGPFEPAPKLAAGVSGGPDSMALALLADAWARERGGALLALIVDHGLRPEAAAEAAATGARLGSRRIVARVLRLDGLARGAGLAKRARDARFKALADACASEGILHLLLGHHAADQAETVLIRELGGSGLAGLAGMAPLVEQRSLRILRPLLEVPPIRLRGFLAAEGTGWVEDPSNRDQMALRPRLRLLRRDRDGTGPATMSLVAAAATAGRRRAQKDEAIAAELAERASLMPEGYATLDGTVSADALAALIQMISGAFYPPARQAVARLAGFMQPATLGGVRLMRAGRLGAGWLLVRETPAAAVPAVRGATWDGRFRMIGHREFPVGTMLGALGEDAARLRRVSRLPAVVLQMLPALRHGGQLRAVPHLHYPDRRACEGIELLFSPSRPAVAVPYRFGDA